MIDLHLHTNHSDGTDSVKTLLKKAQEKGLDVISITDHDSLGAYFEIENNPEIRNIFKGQIIIGSEIKTIFDDINIEILAYGVDYKKLVIKKEDRTVVQNDILKHFIKVAKSLGLKINENIKTDKKNIYASWVFCDEVKKHKENIPILEKLGEVDRLTFYREHEGNKNSLFYYNTSKYYDDCQTLIDKIHAAGGLAFLAHGLIYSFPDNKKAIEKILQTTNIDGLECIYPLFSEEDRSYMINLCHKYHKYISGGTDYHAENKPETLMGTGINNNMNIDKNLINNWIDKIKKI